MLNRLSYPDFGSLWLEKTLSDYAHANPPIGEKLLATRNAVLNVSTGAYMGHVIGGVAGYYGVMGTQVFYDILGNRLFAALYSSSFFALTLQLAVPEIFIFFKSEWN